MANGTIRGITVEIGGDTTKLGKALEGVNKQSRDLSAELGQVNKLLKMDPGNADLLAQKQDILAEAVANTSKKLETLKAAEAQVQEQFKRGEVSEIPAELDEKCRRLIETSFAKQKRGQTINTITKYIAKVAVYVLLFLGAASTLVMSVDALRIPVLNFFLEHSSRDTVISLGEQNTSDSINYEQITHAIDDVLPDTYWLEAFVEREDGFFTILFQSNDSQTVLIETLPHDNTLSIDTENAIPVEIMINGCDALFIEKDGYRVVWINIEKQVSYSVYASAPDDSNFWEIVYTLAR